MASPAHADSATDQQFISFLEQHNLGCGEGSIKCSNDDQVIQIGHSVCYDMDVNGQTPVEAADKLVNIGEDYINKNQADALVAAALVAYCRWDESEVPSGTS